MQNWGRLLEQSKITLNLLRLSRLNPRLLAYAQLNWEFDFNRTPMDPPVIRTLVNNKPHNIGTWAPHIHEVWCIRPEMLYYRCTTPHIPKTAKERVSDTKEFFPGTLTLPRLSSKYAATHAASDLTHALLNPTPNSPLTTIGDKQTSSLRQLAEIFTKALPPKRHHL